MGRKQKPKPSDGRFSQTSIEESIQNLKMLSRKQIERKLMPDEIINISSDDEYLIYVNKKTHHELGIKKFVRLPFCIDSDEDNDIEYSDTDDTTIKNTSSAHERSTIIVLENITLSPPKSNNTVIETSRISLPTVPVGNGQNFSAANGQLPLSSCENAFNIEKKRSDAKEKVVAENENITKASQQSQPQQLNVAGNGAATSNVSVDPAKFKKKRATRKKQSDEDNNGGSPRKITKMEQTPGTSSFQNSSMNVAHFASCVYDTAEPKPNSSGSNQPSANGDKEHSNCSTSKKRKVKDTGKPNNSQHKVDSLADVIKLRDQLISIGKLPKTCTTTNLTELHALLNQDTILLRNPTLAEIPKTSEKTSNGTCLRMSKASGTAANDVGSGVSNKLIQNCVAAEALATGESTRHQESSVNTSLIIQRPTQVPDLSDFNKQVTESTFGEGSSKQADPGSSPTKTHTVPGTVQSTTKTAVTKDLSASVSSPSLEKSSYKKILTEDEARKRAILKNCDSSAKNSTLPTTPDKDTTASVDTNEKTPTKTVPNCEKSQTKTTIASASSFEKTPTKSSSPSISNFEKTPTKRSLFRGSPRKTNMSPKSPKKQSKSTNSRHLELIKEEVFNVVKKSLYAKEIVKNELSIMEQFFNLDVRYQYVCLKLFTYQWKWYNVHKFCRTINVDMDDNEIATMYEYLKDNGYVETNFEKSEDVPHLLQILDCTDLRSICNTFKLNSRVTTKEEMIKLLLKYCKTQCTLTFGKSSRDLLLEKIKDKMGASIKVTDQLRLAFYRLYTMATFSNAVFYDIQDFFKHMLYTGVQFPEYDVEQRLVFWTRNEFLDYVDGVEERKVLNKYFISKSHIDALAHSRDIFEKLKKLPNRDDDCERYTKTPHLRKFSAKSMYISCLSNGCEFLRAKFPEDVRVWLEYLIENFTTYCTLCLIYMSKEKNYKKATNLILQAFTQHESCLNETQKFLLSEKAEMLKCSKKYKIDQLDHDKLAKFVPVPKYNFTEVKIDAKTIRGNESGRKRHYVVQDEDGSSTYLSVENIALRHYIDEWGYTDGEHCEGAIVKCLFNLLFWDIIYDPKKPVPATFISKLQHEEIDRRIEEIRSSWTDAELLAFARKKHVEHAHENSMCLIQNYITDPDMLNVLIPCIGRNVLADILSRLVKDIRQYSSGLPDLMVWNAKEQKCKFVEVKGENDRLSVGQNLWINYLKSIGANVEVCIVHSIGSKRKHLKGSIKQSESMLHGESATL
nr:unnamed protein product [Callosobruchus chinensis]